MKLRIQPMERGANVFDLAIAFVVFSVAQPRAAKIETQHRKTKAVQRLHGVEDDFVVQRASK